MTDIVERLRRLDEDHRGVIDAFAEAAAEIERLREALQTITDHHAAVMGGPLVAGQGIEFANGVEGIPTIARARAALKGTPP